MKHCGTQKIETDRLILRRFEVDDAGAMYKNWASSEDVVWYLIEIIREYVMPAGMQSSGMSGTGKWLTK